MNSDVYLSIVIPVFNEEDNLEPLVKEIEAVMGKVGKKYEIIFIDDKSTDRSFEVLRGA